MTEEQNKLAEEIERLEALQAECAPVPLVFKLGDVDWGKIAAAIRAEREPSVALILRCRNCGSTNVEDVEREPATEAVLRQRMRDIFKNHGVGDGTPGWIEHMGQDGQLRRDSLSFEGELIFNIEALLENAALKGKGNVRLRVPTKKLTC